MKFEKRKPPPSPTKNTNNPQTAQLLAITCTTNTHKANKPDNKTQPKKPNLRRSSAKKPLTTTSR
jgi:hypothetical protein